MVDKPATLSAYHASLTGLGLERFDAIVALIARLVPNHIRSFKYDMPAFDFGNGDLLYVGVWKAHIGLYPIYHGSPRFEALIAPFRSSKDTVKLAHKSPFPLEVVEAIIAERLKGGRRGADDPDARHR